MIQCEELDGVILRRVTQDMLSREFITDMTAAVRAKSAPVDTTELKRLKIEHNSVDKKIQKAMEIALELEDSSPALRQVEMLERKRKELANRLAMLELESKDSNALAHITEKKSPVWLKTSLAIYYHKIAT